MKKLIKRMLLFKDNILIDHRPLDHPDCNETWIEKEIDVAEFNLNDCIYKRNLELKDGAFNKLPDNPLPVPISEDKILMRALRKLLKKEDLDIAKAELEAERDAS